MNGIGISFDESRLIQFCRTWKISRLGLFGSVLADDFSPQSDIDVLVSFEPSAPWNLFDLIDLKSGLAEIFGRKVDLVEEQAIRNPYRRKSIMETRKVIYEAS